METTLAQLHSIVAIADNLTLIKLTSIHPAFFREIFENLHYSLWRLWMAVARAELKSGVNLDENTK